MKQLALLILSFFAVNIAFSQIIDPFAIRYQTNQKGGLTIMANTSLTCNCAGNNEMPPGGTTDNNGVTMAFVDIDTDPTTYNSSLDQLNLAPCSEVLWAGLYWTGNLNNTASTTANYASRGQIKLSVGGGAYTTLVADELLDNTVGKVAFFAFKEITSIVQANPTSGTNYQLANIVSKVGSNTFGGWSIVVVYGNIYEKMKNLTVFDGLANVSAGAAGTVDIALSGFLTPPTGPVNFSLGAVAHDGDRGQTGDQLAFNGAGSYVNITDVLHPIGNSFNSTISNNGVLTSNRNPSYNNNLGHDANIYVPDNSAFNFIGNSATNASIRISTTSETVLTSVITSAIEIYEPDLRASVTYTDLNGGTVAPGDILEYKIVAKNIGSDVSIGTILTDTLDNRLTYLPGTMNITFGPNAGLKTDPIDTDQAEFIAVDNVIRARIGTGANGTIGGAVVNSSTGADSTVLKFQVQLTNDCAVWQCGNILENRAYLFGTGQISGITNGNNGASDLLDASGCPSLQSGTVNVDVSNCADTVITFTDSLCIGELLNLNFPNSSYLTYQWTGPNGFTSTINNPSIPNVQLVHAGDYVLHVFYEGVECISDTTAPVFVSTNPNLNLLDIKSDSCYNLGEGYIEVTGIGNAPFTYVWSNSDADSLAGNLNAGTYSVVATDQYGCTVADTFTLTQPTLLLADATITSNYNGQHISCNGELDGSAQVVASGGVAPYTYLWTPTASIIPTINGLGAGTCVVMVTDGNGCIVEDSVTLTQPAPLNITLASITNILCFGDSSGLIDVSVAGGTAPYAYSWSNGTSLVDLANVPSGFYTDTVTDINGCADTASFSITQPIAGLSMTSTVVQILCFGDTTGSVQLFVSGGVGPYDYTWSNGDLDSLAGNVGIGTYTVTVTDQNNCIIQDTFTLVQPTVLTSVTSVTSNYNGQDISCYGASDGSAYFVIGGGAPSYTYAWLPGLQITDSITNLSAGTYYYTATDLNGCEISDSITLVEPDTITITAVISDILCFGDSTGSIDETISGGTGPYTVEWSNLSTSQDLINLSTGTYTDTVTDVNGCINFVAFVVNQPLDSMMITAITTANLCDGDSTGTIDLTVTGGVAPYTYSWLTGDTIADLTGLPEGNYSVTVTDSNNCSQSIVVAVTTPPVLSIFETHINPVCQNGTQGSISLTITGGTPGYQYTWNNGQFTEDIVNLNAGIYVGVVTDTNNCSDTITVVITDPEAVFISGVATDVLCYSDATGAIDISLANGTPGYIYDWSNGAITQDITNLAAGGYFVDVYDTNGCGGFSSFVILQPDTLVHLTALNVTDILCFGDDMGAIDMEVAGGVVPYSYAWSNLEITQDIQNLVSGIYSVVITDSNMCQIAFADTIFEPTDLVLSETHVGILCYGDSTVSIDLTVVGGVSPYTYLWNTNDTIQDLSNVLSGIYSVTVTDANGCTDTITVTFTEPTAPLSLTASLTTILCHGGDNASIDLTAAGGTPGYTYLWNTSDTIPDLDTLIAGIYTVVATDLNGCVDTLLVDITEPDVLVATGITEPTCFGDTSAAIDLTVIGGELPYSYLWNNGASSEDLSNIGAGIYTVVVTDDNNCQTTYTDTILVATDIVSDETHVNVLCFGQSTGSIDVITNGGVLPYSFEWSNSAVTQDIINISAGNYTLIVSDASNCTDTISVTISQPASGISVTAASFPVLCYGVNNGSIDLNVSGGSPGYTYLWNTGDTIQDVTNLFAGTYSVLVTDTNGCTAPFSQLLAQPATALTLTTSSTPICFGDSTGIAWVIAQGGTPNYNYQWSTGPGATTDSITNLSVGTYTVIVTDSNGCSASTSEQVIIVNELDGCVVIEMPNVFTPNGDNTNDIFHPVKILSIVKFEIVILNRWGNVMYEANDFLQGWDGTTPQGNEAVDGVYFWKLNYVDAYDKTGTMHGNVTLIRN